jgi:hypothetical protein
MFSRNTVDRSCAGDPAHDKDTVTWENMITETLKPAWTGEATIEDTCKKIATSMNETLAAEQQ